MLQNTEAGSGHMLGQLRPGQYHVTLVPAWRCSALPILQHWAPDFLTALQPPALLSPGSTQQTITTSSPSTPHQARGHGSGLGYLLGRWRQNQNLRRPRSWARARCRVWRGSAGGHAGAGPGEAAGAGGCRRRWQVQVAGGGAALARPGPGLSEVWARPRSASLRTAAAHQPGLAWPPAWSRPRHHEGEM